MLPRVKTAFRICQGTAVAVCAFTLSAAPAWAGATLKKVQVTDGSRIDLFFDGKVGAGQIRTEFFNDIIQLSLTDVSVYPAKITSFSGMDLTKIFAYQYAPKLVRCRLTVKGHAESYQGRLQVYPNGKVLTIRLSGAGGSDQLVQSAAMHALPGSAADQSPAAKGSGSNAPPEAQGGGIKISDDEKMLLERVLKGGPPALAPTLNPPAAAAPAPVSKAMREEAAQAPESAPAIGRNPAADEARRPLSGAKPLPNPLRPFGMLMAVLALFGFCALAVKKFRGQNLEGKQGFGKIFGQFASNLGLAKKGKLIEVVATHYLGPKKSIAVVKVAGRMMVLGISNDAINLITQLQPGADGAMPTGLEAWDLESLGMDDAPAAAGPSPVSPESLNSRIQSAMPAGASANGGGATAAGRPMFSDMLTSEQGKPSIRSQIRSKMEGMKQL